MHAPSAHDGVHDEEVHRQQPPDEAVATTALSPIWTKLPNEIIDMVFAEFLSEPAVHFAEIRVRQLPRGVLNGSAETVHQWSDGEMRSGYLVADVLNANSHSARTVVRRVRRATEEKTIIDYGDPSAMDVTVDASTDLACLVLDRWPFRISEPEGHIIIKATFMASRFGTIRRAGMLVTREMWKAVLAHWFDPYLDDDLSDKSYAMNDGRLDFRSLSWVLRSFKRLEAFYLILTDITAEDWQEYYSHFPVTFHDANGSYVEAEEEPIHPWVMFRMWNPHRDQDFFRYPYPYNSKPNVNVDTTFPDRVDSEMDAKLRVRLLLGILDGARYKANGRLQKRELPKQEPRIGVLVRRPAWVVDDSIPKSQQTPEAIDDEFSTPQADMDPDDEVGVNLDDDEGLDSDDPEEDWVREAVDAVTFDSEEAHEDDLADGSSNPHWVVHG
ncbi:hypothetical protein GE09DRAFT_1267427 [Coniochaeta sp. 2T2.1]|nr:hypothetical protein GE09DRAFT_1267427 [Coniochaeta sp. 2T2.1]